MISENDGDVTNYTYDVWGNMTSAGGATYAYNAQGLRISKTVSGSTDNFVLVGGDVWKDSESKYLRGLELISSSDYFYLYNIRGDVIQLLNYSGEVVKTYDYDAYGNELTRDLSNENPFRYCGEYYDTETGFMYLRARYYDPNTGRFTSVDPIKDGLNWYAYCGNDPMNFIDPSGLKFVGDLNDNHMHTYGSAASWHPSPIPEENNFSETVHTFLDVAGMVPGVGDFADGANAFMYTLEGDWGNALLSASSMLPFVGTYVGCVKYLDEAGEVAEVIYDAAKTVNKVENTAEVIHDAGKVVEGSTEIAEKATQVIEGYSNYYQYKKVYGKAGDGMQWHHIVEQSQIKNSGFLPEQIYNKVNTIALDENTHRIISGHYSSKPLFTNGLTVRQWLSGQSYEAQYQYGVDFLNGLGVVVE